MTTMSDTAPVMAPGTADVRTTEAAPPLVGHNETYVVCASPRTGSTLLCSGLARTGVAGKPREFFDDRPDIDAKYKANLKTDNDIDYLAKVLRVSQTPSGVRGLKIHWHQMGTLERMLRAMHQQALVDEPGLSFADLQFRLFGPVRWIWLRRRDKVAQAVSLYRASRSSVWHHPAAKDRRTDDDLLDYDFAGIDRLVHICFQYDVNWNKHLGGYGIVPHTLWYEDFTADYQTGLRGVLDFLGLDGTPVPPPGLNRVSGATSAAWIERYNREKIEQVLKGDARHRLPLVVVGDAPDGTAS